MATEAAAFRVLVATDGSSQAHAAIATVATFPWPVHTRVQAVVARQGRGTREVTVNVPRALAQRWPDAEVVVVDKAPVDGILSEARRFRADVIVVGWRGHGAVRRLLMGSVSRGVVRGARCAVLVVRGRPPRVRKIVIGFDASAGAQLAVTLVGKFVASRDGLVTLITAVQLMSPSSRGPVVGGIRATIAREVRRINTERATEATKALNRAAEELDRSGWRTRYRTENWRTAARAERRCGHGAPAAPSGWGERLQRRSSPALGECRRGSPQPASRPCPCRALRTLIRACEASICSSNYCAGILTRSRDW